jgi:eukaryotic-like serine/threonine-protein kinase
MAKRDNDWTNELFDLVRTCELDVDETIRVTGIAAPTTPSERTVELPRIDIRDEATGDYQLLGVLGRGGMAEVQLAHQRALNREVALKRVSPTDPSPAFARALLHEGRITGRLEHPNIVPVHALGLDGDGQPVIVMKRVEGKPWSRIRVEAIGQKNQVWSGDPLTRHLEIFLDVCTAVAFAHAQGVVHRDIKPANVMVGEFGEVYLLDWGVSVEIGEPAFGHLEGDGVGLPIGTPSYMAPEMVAADATIDARTDVYLLGATLHRMLTGKPRHSGTDLLTVIVAAIASEPFAYADEVPHELGLILNRATARHPSDRFETVTALRDAVADFVRHKGSLELTADAERILERVEDLAKVGDASSQTDLRRMAAECRFAFSWALREWPENDRARRGAMRCVEAMISAELDRGHLDAAEALADNLVTPSDRLSARLAAARARRTKEQLEVASLGDLAFQMDANVGRSQRAVLGGIFAVVCVVTLIIGLLERTVENTHRLGLYVMIPFIVWMALGTYLGRRRLFANAANRRIMSMLAICIGVITIHRAYGLFLRPPLGLSLAQDLLLLATTGACIAVTVERLYMVPVVVWLVGSVICVSYDDDPLHVFAPSMIVGIALLTAITARRARTTARRALTSNEIP